MPHRSRGSIRTALLLAASLAASVPATAQMQQVRVRVTNLAPTNGTALTPVWVGIHNGTFNLFTPGQAVSPALERLAEDGNNAPLVGLFASRGFATQAVLGGAPILPGGVVEHTFMLDRNNPLHRFLSYASMILPSNDAFIGTTNPMLRSLLDANGNFRSFSFVVAGSQVYDAGTEVNDELANSTAFLGQSMEDAGVAENGVARLHAGFNRGGRILSTPQFANADFTRAGYEVARFEIDVVPEPSTYLLMATGLAGLAGFAKRRKRTATV